MVNSTAAYPKMDLCTCGFSSLSTSDVGKECVLSFVQIFSAVSQGETESRLMKNNDYDGYG